MPTSVNINEFFKLSEQHPILDVRTPAEFEQGHIPGAINFPLFTNEERVSDVVPKVLEIHLCLQKSAQFILLLASACE